MHQFLIEDENGELIDVKDCCSDSCHKEIAGEDYMGWNGCHEVEFDTVCENCGEKIEGFRGDHDDPPIFEKIPRRKKQLN